MVSGDTWLPSVQNNLVMLQKDFVNRPSVCDFCLRAIAKGVLERSFTTTDDKDATSNCSPSVLL